MYVNPSDPHENIHNSMQYDLLHDQEYSHLRNKGFWEKCKELTPKKDADLHLELKKLPRIWVKMIPFEKLIKQSYPIHALNLRDDTEKLLCHHRLGHTCDQYLYNTHKYIDGVPKLSNTTYKVIDKRPTLIQANISKTPTGHGTTGVKTQPYQGLYIEFDFSGMTSDDNDQKNIYGGINC